MSVKHLIFLTFYKTCRMLGRDWKRKKIPVGMPLPFRNEFSSIGRCTPGTEFEIRTYTSLNDSHAGTNKSRQGNCLHAKKKFYQKKCDPDLFGRCGSLPGSRMRRQTGR